jgi:hypothetical protein
MRRVTVAALLMLAVPALAGPALAGPADVTKVEVVKTGDHYRFDVTVRHDDTGPEHYADRWEVLLTDGTVIGTRILLQPHVGEQPFTRSLGGVKIPDSERSVRVRARDVISGYGGKEVLVAVPR